VLAHEAALGEVIAALQAREIHPLLIKGPVTARLLYDAPSERPFCDLDLLVAPASFTPATAALEALGFRSLFEGARSSEVGRAHAEAWARSGPLPVKVDLHRSLYLTRNDGALFDAFSRSASTIVVAGTPVHTPSAGAFALILVLHAVQHEAVEGAARAPEDLRRAIIRLPEPAWREAASLADELEVGWEFAAGLRATPDGAALAARLVVAPTATTEARLNAVAAPGGARQIARIVGARSPRLAATLVRDAVLPSPVLMRVAHPEAASSKRRLVGAYLRRFARAPRALREYVRGAGSSSVLLNGFPKLPGYLEGAAWAIRATRRCHGQLRAGGLKAVALPVAPRARSGSLRGLRDGMRVTGATCLERSLARRAWHARQGRDVRVVIGVRGSGETFGAHAWLEGDPHDPGEFAELLRWPS
jgi:hypothetical protein